MFETKLQEYCQSKAWSFPTYGFTESRRGRRLHFIGDVEVDGITFRSPHLCSSIMEARSFAAKFAYEQLVGFSDLAKTWTTASAPRQLHLPNAQQASPTNAYDAANRVSEDNSTRKDMGLYKNKLQEYAQKRNLEFPLYSFEKLGPSHANLFKSKVTLEGKTYESEFFHTLKQAESAAAKVALDSVLPQGIQELQDDPVMYKNLLQELVQKEVSCLPYYNTDAVGPPHMPVFFSTVEIQGQRFKGQAAKTKKQAEMNVAKVAYMTLRERIAATNKPVTRIAAVTAPNLKGSSSIPDSPSCRPSGGMSLDNVTNVKKRKNDVLSQRSTGAYVDSKLRIQRRKLNDST